MSIRRLEPTDPPPGRRRGVTAVVVAVLTALCLAVLAGCGGGEATASMLSGGRPAGAGADGGDEGAAGAVPAGFCEALRELAEDQDDDVEADQLLEGTERLRDTAPEELRDEVDVLVRFARRLSELDLEDDDPAAIGEMLELVMDPQVMAATTAIEAYSIENCGIDLDSGGDPGDPDLPALPELPGSPQAPGDVDIDLDDIDAVEDAATSAGATWPAKISGTSIQMDREVALLADEAAGLTVEEALVACTEVRAALVLKNPAVTVEVRSGERAVVASPSGGECVAL